MEINKPHSNALLILDGASQHNTPQVNRKLRDSDIMILLLPAHSSHLTQPCDRLLFNVFKQNQRKRCRKTNLTGASRRILKVMNALDSAITPLNCRWSFERAGFFTNQATTIPTVTFDRNTVLASFENPRNPEKKKPAKRRRKRIPLLRGKTKKQCLQEARRVAEQSSNSHTPN